MSVQWCSCVLQGIGILKIDRIRSQRFIKVNYDCYNCDAYICHFAEEMEHSNIVLSTFESCARSGSTTSESHHEESDHSTNSGYHYVVHDECVNVTSQCFPVFDCTCPSGIALLSSRCLQDSLHRNIFFFLLIMAIITVFSLVFEFFSHNVEHVSWMCLNSFCSV